MLVNGLTMYMPAPSTASLSLKIHSVATKSTVLLNMIAPPLSAVTSLLVKLQPCKVKLLILVKIKAADP